MRIERIDGSRRDEVVDFLCASEPFLPYRNFPPIGASESRLLELNHTRFRRAAEVFAAFGNDDSPLAAVAIGPRTFETDHFDLRMAKIDAAIAVAGDEIRQSALAALYAAVRDHLRHSGYHHMAAQASANDRAAGWALQAVGAFYVGTKISWMQSLTGKGPLPRLDSKLHFEHHESAAIGRVASARSQRLLDWCATAFDRGPHVFDLTVPLEKARRLYLEWTLRALRGDWADALLLVCEDNEIIAFHSMMKLDELSRAAGETIVGRGIGASLPGYRGLFTALQQYTSAVRPLGAAFLENETQASTIPSIQVFGKLGHRCTHSTASFHMRLDGAPLRND